MAENRAAAREAGVDLGDIIKAGTIIGKYWRRLLGFVGKCVAAGRRDSDGGAKLTWDEGAALIQDGIGILLDIVADATGFDIDPEHMTVRRRT